MCLPLRGGRGAIIRNRRLFMPRQKQTHCRRGHERTPDNVGINGHCLTCERQRGVRCYMRNPSVYLKRNTKRAWRLSGWSVDAVERARVNQQGRCAVCLKLADLVPDHKHVTPPQPRELLCEGCNSAIGFLKESPEACEAAAAYLRKHNLRKTCVVETFNPRIYCGECVPSFSEKVLDNPSQS